MGTPSDVMTLRETVWPKKTSRTARYSSSWRIVITGVLAIVFFAPFWWMVVISLLPNRLVLSFPPQWFPFHPEWRNFFLAWEQPYFARYVINSLLVSVAIVIGQLMTSSLAAYAIARISFSGRRLVYWLLLVTLMIPGQVTFIPVFLIMKHLGWIDTYQALIVPFIGSAFATFWLIQSFRQVPQVILDAAQIDGAEHFWIFMRIILPLNKSALLSIAFLNFVFHYNDFFWPLIVTQSNSMRTFPVGLSYLIASDGSGTMWNVLMASTLIGIVPVLLIFFVGQRFLVQGISSAGIKE
ncbi:carbohydrate ABC transporter permease [Alicyclobacillus tolerans]|uniref:ABC-type glycerol-3-phosphate transport system permease component n=1 Tax=Alicyclobacillus tolerans TaxID=90970 RepID=A0ABT9LYV0_9BACL|nr:MULTISPECIES: carbohydrate ABC transporter permease [Alicyclobacillus]MDP9729447.1 ABC-type glycerol-3-phosphate transport system permease component [Alicyclobacillus tengchongensis]QRF22813.1 carbohydrate ABC transporter permease [Alicyclobacillus sp. TC]